MKIQHIIYIIILIIFLLYFSTFSCIEGFSPILTDAPDIDSQISFDLITVNTTINAINDILVYLKNVSFNDYDSTDKNSIIYGFMTDIKYIINGNNNGITTNESLQTYIDRIAANMEYKITYLYGQGNQQYVTDDITLIKNSLNSIYLAQLQISILKNNLDLLKNNLDNLNNSNQNLNSIISNSNTAITNGLSIDANQYNDAINTQKLNIGVVLASIDVMLKNISFIQTNLQNAFINYGISWKTS